MKKNCAINFTPVFEKYFAEKCDLKVYDSFKLVLQKRGLNEEEIMEQIKLKCTFLHHPTTPKKPKFSSSKHALIVPSLPNNSILSI